MAEMLYENFVLENKMTDLVNTNLDVHTLFTIDNSLEGVDGMQKVINKYTFTGKVEKLAKGAKNTTRGAVTMVPATYTIERYQQTVDYNDEDVMKDSFYLDTITTGAATLMANNIKEQYFAELAKINNSFEYTTFNYDAVVDALAQIGREVESDQIIVMGIDAKAAVRKDPDYKSSRQGEILYTGQFGDICGVPCVCSKLVPAGTIYITAKDQVKFLVKKNGFVEQDRDIETKDNTIVYSRYGLMALVDETKSIKMVKKAG
jgi:hypothetical protein